MESSPIRRPPGDGPIDPDAFRSTLSGWFESVARPLPWRTTDDPYRIWVSEVMLQQTRVDQAIPYYEQFVGRFPDVSSLAGAPLDEVLRLWEGLGYYSRARNLHRAARIVVDRFAGRIPRDPGQLRELPGIGEYTCAAIVSIAFGVPIAAMDGNVTRVLARLTADGDDITRAATRRRLRSTAERLLDPDSPGRHNEAMMELGATVCMPLAPACDRCPVSLHCAALRLGAPEAYPVRRPRATVPHRDIAVGIVRDDNGRLLIQRRAEDAMLGGLWEFPGGKCEPGEPPLDACRRELREELGIEVSTGARIAEIDHAYSHFRITLHAFPCRIRSGEPQPRNGQPIAWVTREELSSYAFPRANRKLIETLADADS